MTAFLSFLRAHPRTVTTVCIALLALVAGSSLLIDSHHAHTWAEQHVPFFWSLFGFAAAAVIIGVTRLLGRSGIQAPTDFYTCSNSTLCEEEE
jgi:hypothetical protein